MNYQLLGLLEKVLGKSTQTSGNNFSFYSPFCAHHKKKLEINLDTNNGKNLWHCWVSDERGKTIYSLFKKIKADKKYFNELKECVAYIPTAETSVEDTRLTLPEDFLPVSDLSKRDLYTPAIRNALNYLIARGITVSDVKRYNIGICLQGDFANRIIVPSYNETGELNYFVGRSFLKTPYIKYKYPKKSKNIVPFEMYINWNLPVFIVEGVFDAIAVKFNAIPLLGKVMPGELMSKIMTKKPPIVYLALDKDATQNAIKIAKTLFNSNINVKLITLNGKDPSELGHTMFLDAIKTSAHMTREELLKMELSL